MIWLTDPKTKEKSVTLTFFAFGVLVATAKLLFSGASFNGWTLSPFTGGDFAAAVGALGAIYAARKHTDAKSTD